ncbi:MBL fold metallo-hydrolase [Natronomonas sp. EA1]|uniref:MBL fold metallo-hydrolase n=1 Tax=Natronomonas sp. EA1 TaxID=3421655 RepID=UPI003EBC2B6C
MTYHSSFRDYAPTEEYVIPIGAVDCRLVTDGTRSWDDPAATLFADVSDDELAAALVRYGTDLDGWQRHETPCIALLVETGSDTVLIDTGLGDDSPDGGLLRTSLRRAGVEPPDIDVVVLTHAHPDQIGGALTDGEPTFPNARYAITHTERSFWLGDAPTHLPEHIDEEAARMLARETILGLGNRLDVVETTAQIVPGVRLIPAGGHTPGHVAVRVDSGAETLLYMADAVAHPVQFENPEWVAGLDNDEEHVIETRERLFALAADNDWLVVCAGAPTARPGHVVHEGDAYRFIPQE